MGWLNTDDIKCIMMTMIMMVVIEILKLVTQPEVPAWELLL